MLNISSSISGQGNYLGLRTTRYAYPLSDVTISYESKVTEKQAVKVKVGYNKDGVLSYKSKHTFPKWVQKWLLTEYKLREWES